MTLFLLAASVLFAVILTVKKAASLRVCVLCATILLGWLALFILYRMGRFQDAILLALLMGQSITGIYYYTEKRVTSTLRIFTLPFFLSLTALFYFAITLSLAITVWWVLLGLWIAAYVIFTWRNDPGKQAVAGAVMRCCEDK